MAFFTPFRFPLACADVNIISTVYPSASKQRRRGQASVG